MPASQNTNPSPPLPAILPPINEVSQNILREWCHCHNLSTDGKKVEVYLRLQKNSYSKQKMSYSPKHLLKPKWSQFSKNPKQTSEDQGLKAWRGREVDGIVEVITSERESIFAARVRIAIRAARESPDSSLECQDLSSASHWMQLVCSSWQATPCR